MSASTTARQADSTDPLFKSFLGSCVDDEKMSMSDWNFRELSNIPSFDWRDMRHRAFLDMNICLQRFVEFTRGCMTHKPPALIFGTTPL